MLRRALRARFGLIALAWAANCRAAPGTTSPDFLRIGVAPRPVAMGEAFTGMADDVNAIAYNPAGLAFVERQEISVVHNMYLDGVQQDYLAYVLPTYKYGSAAFGANQLRVAPFDSFSAEDRPAGTVSAQDLSVSGAYAARWRSAAFGVAVKHISSRLAGFTAATNAYDLGALWRLPNGFSLGVARQNMGSGLVYESASQPLPSQTRLGGSWKGGFLWPGSSSALSLDGVFARERKFIGAGAEVWLTPFAALRVGYLGSEDSDIGFSWGAGFKLPLRRRASSDPTWKAKVREDTGPAPELQIDYAFARMGDLGLTHRLSISLRFGRSTAEPAYKADWKEIKVPKRRAESPAKEISAPERVNEGDFSPSWR